MWPVFVIISPPIADDLLGIGQLPELMFNIQALVAETPMKVSNKAVLGRLPTRDQI